MSPIDEWEVQTASSDNHQLYSKVDERRFHKSLVVLQVASIASVLEVRTI